MSLQARHYDRDISSLFKPLKGKDALKVLTEGAVALEEHTWWLSAGTLLGLERDGNFIPHDTDIDIGVVGNIKRTNMPHGFSLIRTIDDGSKQLQTVYVHEEENIIFDILHYWEESEDMYYTQGQEGFLYRPKYLLDEAIAKIYLGQVFNVPSSIDEYLTLWYNDWRTPVVGGKTEWKK